MIAVTLKEHPFLQLILIISWPSFVAYLSTQCLECVRSTSHCRLRYNMYSISSKCNIQGHHSPDNMKFPDSSRHSACQVLLISCPH